MAVQPGATELGDTSGRRPFWSPSFRIHDIQVNSSLHYPSDHTQSLSHQKQILEVWTVVTLNEAQNEAVQLYESLESLKHEGTGVTLG